MRRALFLVLLLAGQVAAQESMLTTVKETVYASDWSSAAANLVISWEPFLDSANKSVGGGIKTVMLSSGMLAVPLVPNVGGTRSGPSYKGTYYKTGTVFAGERWVIPASLPP